MARLLPGLFVFSPMLASREILKEQHYSCDIEKLALLGWLSTECRPQHISLPL